MISPGELRLFRCGPGTWCEIRRRSFLVMAIGYCHQKVGLCWAILGFRGGTLRISWYVHIYIYVYIYIYQSGYFFFGWRSTKLVCKWVGYPVMSRGARNVQRAKRCWPPSNQSHASGLSGSGFHMVPQYPLILFWKLHGMPSLIPQHHYISLLIIFIHAAYSIINPPFYGMVFTAMVLMIHENTRLCHHPPPSHRQALPVYLVHFEFDPEMPELLNLPLCDSCGLQAALAPWSWFSLCGAGGSQVERHFFLIFLIIVIF